MYLDPDNLGVQVCTIYLLGPFGLQQPCRMPDRLNLNLFKDSTLNPEPQTLTPEPYRLNISVRLGYNNPVECRTSSISPCLKIQL